jgi:phage/plasmid-like protein (TIGR03299 family)
MSHMLEKAADGTYRMAYAGETPWHDLGNRVGDNLTPREMLKAAQCDFKTILVPATYNYKGKKLPTGTSALIREEDGRFFCAVPDGWKPVQPVTGADFFVDYCDEAKAAMHTAGSIDDGRKIWLLAKLKKDKFSMFNGKDVTEPYLLFTLPNIYGMSTSVSLTAIRVVCNNTLTLSLGQTKGDKIVRVSHRREFIKEDVQETLGVVTKKMEQYHEALTFLSTKKASPEKISEYLRQIFPIITAKVDPDSKEMSKNAKIALAAVEQQPGATLGEGTWFAPYQAVTFTADHLMGRNASTRLNSAFYGDARAKKHKALNTALEFANAA